ncbi:MAG: sugar transferase [Chloroflexi bacterium]|nr:sugar transferase [Chloroflexota bacterium]
MIIGGLGVTALVYVPIALVIKFDSRGPVVFAQDRVGEDERVFRLYKFRTMYLNSGRHGLKPAPNDERVTRVGRFLRRTSLDELPQFFNILRGEMRLVGPRPEQLSFLAHCGLAAAAVCRQTRFDGLVAGQRTQTTYARAY